MPFDILLGWAPLALAAMGALWTEFAGVLCVCVEGFMNLGAFLTFAGCVGTGSAAAGVAFGMAATALCGFACARAICRLRLNPFVAGLAASLVCDGLCALLSRRFFGDAGALRLAAFAPEAAPPSVRAAGIAFVCAALAATALSAVLPRVSARCRRLRAVGRSPQAALEHGIDVEACVVASWTAAAALSALAGAALLFRVGAFVPNAAAGRGWLALAAVYMGFQKAPLCAASALFFAACAIASGAAQKAAFLPPRLTNAIPYALALVFYALSRKPPRKAAPSAPP